MTRHPSFGFIAVALIGILSLALADAQGQVFNLAAGRSSIEDHGEMSPPGPEDTDAGGNGPNNCGGGGDGGGGPAPFLATINSEGGPMLDAISLPMLPRKGLVLPSLWWVSEPVVMANAFGPALFMSNVDMTWPHHGTWFSVYRAYRHAFVNDPECTLFFGDFGALWDSNLTIQVQVVDETETNVSLGLGFVLKFDRVGANPDSSKFISLIGFERFKLEERNCEQYVLTDKNGYEFLFEARPNAEVGAVLNLSSTRNRYGQGEDYFYDASNRLTRVSLRNATPAKDILITRSPKGLITKIADYAGREITYEYDASCRLIKVLDTCGTCSALPTVNYVYGLADRLSEIRDADDALLYQFGYSDGDIIEMTVGTDTFQYEYGNLQIDHHKIIDPEGNEIRYHFDRPATKLLLKKTILMDPADPDDDIIEEFDWGPNCRPIEFLYRCNWPGSPLVCYSPRRCNFGPAGGGGRAAPAGGTRGECNTTDPVPPYNGNLLDITLDCNGEIITVGAAEYEAQFNRITSITDALGNRWDYAYDAVGSLTTISTSPVITSQSFEYDTMGLLTRAVDTEGVVTVHGYDGMGFRTSTTVDPTPGLNLTTTFGVDDLGRVTSITDPESQVTTFEYDDGGKITRQTTPEQIATAFEYDDNGRLTRRTRNDGGAPTFVDLFQYNARGLVSQETDPLGRISTFTYDGMGRLSVQTLPGNRVTDFTYDALGRILKQRSGDGTLMLDEFVRTYIAIGEILTDTDGNGNTTSFEYDPCGRKTKETSCNGDFKLFDNDDLFRPIRVRANATTGSQLAITTDVFAYDGIGRLTRQAQYLDGVDDATTDFGYDNRGRLTSRTVDIDGANSKITQFTYDNAGRLTLSTDPDMFATQFQYDGAGRRTLRTDANNNTTTFAYDLDDRLISTTPPLEARTEHVYDSRGLILTASRVTGASPGVNQQQTRFEYDAAGRRTLSRGMSDPTGPPDDTKDFVEKTIYDDGDRVTQTISASGGNMIYHYDAFDRLTLAFLPDASSIDTDYDNAGNVTRRRETVVIPGEASRIFIDDFEYDCRNRLTLRTNLGPDGFLDTPDDLTVSFVYDPDGNQISLTDEAGRITTTEYDNLERQTKVTEDDGGISKVTTFAYDRASRLTQLVAKGSVAGDQTTAYQYNKRDLQTVIDYPGAGSVSMAYDSVGNLTLRTDENGTPVQFTYDAEDRLTERKNLDTPDQDIEAYEYGTLGQLTTAQKGTESDADSVSRTRFNYDKLGRVLGQIQHFDGVGRGANANAVFAQYDKGGNRTLMKSDDTSAAHLGPTNTYAYDNRDRVTKIEHQRLDADPLLTLAEYTWLGNSLHRRTITSEKSYLIGAITDRPRFKTEFLRDGIWRITRAFSQHLAQNQADAGYNDLGSFDYTYDDASNLLSATQTGSMGELDADRTYFYDTLNRITKAHLSDTQNWSPASQAISTYDYGKLGNREKHKYRGPPQITYSHDAANRMTTLAGQSQGYDDAGNQLTGFSADRTTSYVYKYDHNNRLIEVWNSTETTRKAAYNYDALGRRIEFINDLPGTTTRYYYDGFNEILEADENGVRLRYFVHGPSYVDERVMMYDDDTERPYYYTIDRQYNVRMLIDWAGAVVERYAYDPYGRPLIRESAGHGDMNNDTRMLSADSTRVSQAQAGTIWDPRADMDHDGDVDLFDTSIYPLIAQNWDATPTVTVSQAFSDVGNPFMFQGRTHFALDTAATATEGKLMLNDHRMRMMGVAIGRWLTRDPIGFDAESLNLYEFEFSRPTYWLDPSGNLPRGGLEMRSVHKSLREMGQSSEEAAETLTRMSEFEGRVAVVILSLVPASALVRAVGAALVRRAVPWYLALRLATGAPQGSPCPIGPGTSPPPLVAPNPGVGGLPGGPLRPVGPYNPGPGFGQGMRPGGGRPWGPYGPGPGWYNLN